MSEIDPFKTANPQPNEPADRVVSSRPGFTIGGIFVGADGLRAGWGVILFFTLFLALLFAGGLAVHKSSASPATGPNAGMSARLVFQNEGISFVSVLLATWLMAKIERRPTSAYGFRPQRGLRNFCAGLASGVTLLSLLVFILRATGLLVFEARLLTGSHIVRYGTIWLGNFLLVGLFEELMNRGYLQFTLTRGLSGLYRWLFGATHSNALGFWTAALILSFVFGFGHRTNPGESPLGLLSAGLAGFLFCFSLWRTGSLWWAIGFHAAWDWAESSLYGVADSGLLVKGRLFATHPVGRPYLSGGLTGPEGSLFLLPVMLAGVAVILFTLPRTNDGYQPPTAPTAVAALDLP